MEHGALGYSKEGPTAEICRFAHELRYEVVDPKIIDRARHLALDGICCALVGAHLPWSEIAYNGIADGESEGSAAIWGWGTSLSPSAAAMLNSAFIEGFELDDYHEFGAIHSSSVVLPSAFSMAAGRKVSGKDLLAALVVGYEVGPRLGMSIGGYGGMIARGWHAGSVVGTVVGALTAGKIAGLDEFELQDACGIAGTQSSGLMAGQYEAMAKRMDHGFAARAGVVSVQLAGTGYTGIKQVLERSYGGLSSAFIYPEPPNLERLLDKIGVDWELERIIIKPFPANGTASLGIEAMLIARNERNVRAEDVEEIVIALPEHPYLHVGFEITRPPTAIGAQMNSAYLAAVALIDGEVTTKQFAPQRSDADDVWALIERIHPIHDEVMDEVAKTGYNRATEARIRLKDGREETIRVLLGPGTRERILTNEQIRDKFHRCTKEVIDNKHTDAIEQCLLGIDDAADISELVGLLTQKVHSPFAE